MNTGLTEKGKEILYKIADSIKEECEKHEYKFNDKDGNRYKNVLD